MPSCTSAKCEIGFRKWTPPTDPSPHAPQIMGATDFQSSTILRSVQWCDHVIVTFQKLVQSFKLIYCTCFFLIGSLHFNQLNSFLNCSMDFRNILNYLIPWDINYTQACTTPITKIQSKHSSDYYMSLQLLLQELNRIILHVKQIERIEVNCIAQEPLHAVWLRRLQEKV